MTIKELIAELSNIDEDIKGYEVRGTFVIKLSDTTKISGGLYLDRVPENVDVDAKCIYLKFRGKK